MTLPTQEIYADLQRAFQHFNDELFDGELPPCVITLQREKDTVGYFSRDRWANTEGEQRHEISMNPSYFVMQPIQVTLSNLVHDMTHMYQALHGTPGRNRYHNTEWGNLLEQKAGLMPTSTGLPGGKRKGDQMKHYIIEGGRFDESCKKLIDADFTLRWMDRFPNKIEQPEFFTSAMSGLDLGGDSALEQIATPAHAQVAESNQADSLSSRIVLDDESKGEAPESPDSKVEGGEDSPSPSKKKPQGPPPPPMKVFVSPNSADLERLGIEPPRDKKSGKPNRFKFTCPVCSFNAWAKPDGVLCCGTCPNKPLMPGVPA